MERPLQRGSPVASHRARRGLVPYLLSFPGLLWLVIFFAVPMITMASTSLQEGSLERGFEFTGNWRTYTNSLAQYDVQMIRSIVYGLVVTVLTLVISYPMAYWIALKAERAKNLFLLLMLMPFFTPFLIRTLSWRFLLADNGVLLGTLKDWGLVGESFRLLATSTSVIAGMTYNFLPFMALPLYVALEKMDPTLLDAASDLYSSRRQAFLKVTLPLSMPGVLAGSLLTFIPATGDFIDPELLGGVNQTVIGQVIYREFLTNFDYPTGAALSFILMGGILLGVFFYVRALGTEELTG